MILDLKKAFITEGYLQPIKYELDLSDVDYYGVFPMKTPVAISGEVTNRAGVVHLRIHCAVLYEAPCDRCGNTAAKQVAVDSEYILTTELQNEDNDSLLLIEDMELNLDELCRTDVLLHIPMKHLCREDCKGICPKCGKNLNEGSCGCSFKEIDPRLQALADLID